MTKSLHDKVKKESAKAHAALDQNTLMKKIMSPTVNMDDYQLFLEAFFSIYKALESNVYQLSSQFIPNILKNQRFNDLKNDLNQFNNRIKDCPLNSTIVFNKNNILGALYVFEGSRHGAVYIAKHLKKKLDLADNKLQFLLHSPTIKWNEIITTLNNVDESNHNHIIEGVNTTFNVFSNYFNNFKNELVKDEDYHL